MDMMSDMTWQEQWINFIQKLHKLLQIDSSANHIPFVNLVRKTVVC